MIETDVMDPPDLKPLPPTTKFERERRAFARLKPELLDQYRGQYVAIHEEKVVGRGDDHLAVTMEAYRKFGYVAIYVDLITDEPQRPVRVPSIRVLS